jgi:hypothetical protein
MFFFETLSRKTVKKEKPHQAEINAAPTQNLGSPTSPGDLRFKDVNGDGVVDFKDRTYIGKSIADYLSC